jgi:taurine transport system permease protein
MTGATEIQSKTPLKAALGAVRTSRYQVLGEGSSVVLSLLSIAGLLALWWVATHTGWIKPLFLPQPEAIWLAFQQAVGGELDDHTLWVHFMWSMYRVFSAFVLAVLIGIPVGIAMVSPALHAGCSIRRSSFTGLCRRSPTFL